MAADNQAASKSATDAYRNRLFAGVGGSFHEALHNAVGQAKAAGFGNADPVAHRFVPKDADWNDTDWNDTDWRDTDWRDTDWNDTNMHAVLVHGRNS